MNYGNIKVITFDRKPPSQPSPRGEGAMELFPLGGNQKGGLKHKELYSRTQRIANDAQFTLFILCDLCLNFANSAVKGFQFKVTLRIP
jgi:hypothetical protein